MSLQVRAVQAPPRPAPPPVALTPRMPVKAASALSHNALSATARSPAVLPASRPAAHPRPDDDTYLPRSALTQPPVAQGGVALTYPDDAPPGRLTARLTLFIDASGTVQRLRIEGTGLPPAFERAVRSAFMASRWTPGEVDGQPVKVRSLIEVEFAADPPPLAAGTPAPAG